MLTRPQIVKAPRALEKGWPKDGTMIMANGHFLYLCSKHPESGGKVLESFDIRNDGGDPEWGDDDTERPKRLANFKPPSTRIGPRPSFTGKIPK